MAPHTSPSPTTSADAKQKLKNPPAPWETPTINALAETVNGLYKAELIHQHTWDGLADVEWETMCWVHWWNTNRLHSELGYHPPQEIEDHYWATNPATLIPAV